MQIGENPLPATVSGDIMQTSYIWLTFDTQKAVLTLKRTANRLKPN